jgi:uncharacterized phage protein (TIGR02218 family)
MATLTDFIGPLSLTVTGCTGNGVTPIVLTCSQSVASVKVGQQIVVASVGGNTNANGTKTVTAVNTTSRTITFAGTGNGAYTSGGTVAREYATIEAWNQATRTTNLTGGGDLIQAWLCNDANSGAGITDFSPPTTNDFNATLTSNTNYRQLAAWPTDVYDPFERKGVRIDFAASATSRMYAVHVNEPGFRLIGVGVRLRGTVNQPASGLFSAHAMRLSQSCIVDGCFVDVRGFVWQRVSGNVATCTGRAVWIDGTATGTSGSVRVWNTIVKQDPTAEWGGGATSKQCIGDYGIDIDRAYTRVLHCNVLGFQAPNAYGIRVRSAQCFVQNNAVLDVTIGFRGPSGLDFDPTSVVTHNAIGEVSFGLSAVQVGTLTGVLSVTAFRYFAFEDYRLTASSVLADNGTGPPVFGGTTTDRFGVARVAPHEIGAHSGVELPDERDPTIIESTIGAGKTYTTAQAWADATAKNLVTANERHVGLIYGTLTEDVVLTGAVADQWRYRELKAADGERYDPVNDTGARIIGSPGDNWGQVALVEDYARFGGGVLVWSNESFGSGFLSETVGVFLDGESITVDGVFAIIDTNPDGGTCFYLTDATNARVRNCIAVGGTTTAGAHYGFLAVDGALIENCTALRCRNAANWDTLTPTGFISTGTSFVRNCIASTPGAGVCFNVVDGYQSHNASSDTTAGGFGSNVSITNSTTWVDASPTPPDLRLISSSVCVDSGARLTQRFSTDFFGVTRGRAWEKGAIDGYATPPAWPAPRIFEGASLAWAWDIERADGVVKRFTDAPTPIAIAGLTYSPGGAMDASARRSEVGVAEHSVNVRGAISSDALSHDDLLAGRFNEARIIETMASGEFPWLEPYWFKAWKLREVRFDGERFSADLIGLSRALEARVGDVYSSQCSAVVGDHRCGVDLPSLTAYGCAVSSVTNERRTFRASVIGSAATGYYSLGRLTWTGGANVGLESEVLLHSDTNLIDLFLETVFPIEVGDTFEVSPGCDLSSATCSSKFNNLPNHRGFPLIPGSDRALDTPRSS